MKIINSGIKNTMDGINGRLYTLQKVSELEDTAVESIQS